MSPLAQALPADSARFPRLARAATVAGEVGFVGSTAGLAETRGCTKHKIRRRIKSMRAIQARLTIQHGFAPAYASHQTKFAPLRVLATGAMARPCWCSKISPERLARPPRPMAMNFSMPDRISAPFESSARGLHSRCFRPPDQCWFAQSSNQARWRDFHPSARGRQATSIAVQIDRFSRVPRA